LRWSEFQEFAFKASRSLALVSPEREIILWLIRMANGIGTRDLKRE
jgi:DNA-binding CsgD family transcriptional regulator